MGLWMSLAVGMVFKKHQPPSNNLDGAVEIKPTRRSIDPCDIIPKYPIGYDIVRVDMAAYGAVGDGATDNATVIQQAINDFSMDRVSFFFPVGTYKVGENGLIKVITE